MYFLFLSIVSMKKALWILFASVLLVSCSMKIPFLSSNPTPKDGDTVSVNYVGTLDDGTEFDSSIKPGRVPLEFTVGRHGVIKGFEDAIIGMKVGEKKKIRIEPKDAYGEEYTQETVPLSQFKDVISQTVPANVLIGTVEQKIPRAQAEKTFSSLTVGVEKKLWEASLKILSISGDDIVVAINDPKAIFYGKKIAVGLHGVAPDGSDVTVTKIDGKNVSVDIKQKQEIISKTDKDVTLKVKNPHPLAGKALNFELELLQIKNSDSAAS